MPWPKWREAIKYNAEIRNTLIRKNWRNFSRFFLVQLWQGINEAQIVFFMVALCLAISGNKFALFAVVAYALNVALVASSLMMADRYLFYSNYLIYMVLLTKWQKTS